MSKHAINSPFLIGLDIGTSSCKGIAFDLRGNAITNASIDYAPVHSANGYVEQNPEEWVDATVKVLQRIALQLRELDIPLKLVAGIGMSAQISTHMLLDDRCKPLCDAILWQDRRAEREALQVQDEWTPERLEEELGLELPVGSSWPMPRLMWIKTHKPELLAKMKYWCQPKDYVGYRLTGELASELSSNRGLVNMRTAQISPAVCNYLGISPEILPPLLEPTARVGNLTRAMQELTGFSRETAVFVGWNDYHCALIGGGIYRIGMGFDVTGTSEHAGIIIRGDHSLPLLKGINRVPLLDNRSVVYGPTSSGGGALQWYVENIVQDEERKLPLEQLYERVMREAEQAEPGCKGLLFLPYLNGERAPIWDSHATGVFFGLQTQHTRKEMSRAVMEGVAFSIRHIGAAITNQTGLEPSSVRVTGGSGRNRIWNQVKADILQKPLEIAEEWNSGALGAAILAAVGLGIYSNIEEAVDAMVRIAAIVEPNLQNGEVYSELFSAYESLYPALQPIFHKQLKKVIRKES